MDAMSGAGSIKSFAKKQTVSPKIQVKKIQQRLPKLITL